MSLSRPVSIIGAGLAGCEAAWQLSRRGIPVRLLEQKPERRTPAQNSDQLAELVCSNSFRSSNTMNAVGLLKEEMAAAGSLILWAATQCRVPAGDALAVDRDRFAALVTETIRAQPGITLVEGEATELPDDGPVIVATGPLTSDRLAERIGALTGESSLYFYDSIAPIVEDESIDREIVYAASRYGKGDGDDYLNCPMDREQYQVFYDALCAAERVPLREFEKPRYFEGCLPIEIMAERGVDTLRYGPMKPVGLPNPRTGKDPYAVVQLRRENVAGTAWNLVGFQTKLKYPEQLRVFRLVPGLESVSFLRMGSIHRNTFIHSPSLLDANNRLRSDPRIRFAGQITGVEGYVESTASGLLTSLYLAAELQGSSLASPPPETALGAMMSHVHGPGGKDYQPHNIHFGLFPPLGLKLRKRERKAAYGERARDHLAAWLERWPLEVLASP
ncbi:MAG: methylenetetrahydrofolate--tRNA-(uracil(54)-C(5))-methyltransferase (FADH(2)-oxidizing) TrmFO [Deltaproteobacteria bacterium]|nr:methylenetetrahydrofolate--tRNA-(uracil(54)-C(5))-methyltransferase (FADH(2)-oxidizing) TrmFO [Deltaproteobacteria bacterium]